MATRSTISIRNVDNTVTSIYCHWDGSLAYNGRMLYENYTTEESVRELLSLGDLSSLGNEIGEKADPNNYDSHRGQCVAYGRDLGDTGVEAITFDSWNQMLMEQRQEYNYLFVPGEGWCVERNGRIRDLSEAFNG